LSIRRKRFTIRVMRQAPHSTKFFPAQHRTRAGTAAVVALAALFCHAPSARADCPEHGSEAVTVAAITDRLEIVLLDGRTLRLAGVDMPDPTRGEVATAADAKAWLSKWLIGQAADALALAVKPDRWRRVVAEVFAPESGSAVPVSVSEALLAAGFARVRPELEARPCIAGRLVIEDAARSDGLGVWIDPYYAVAQATDVADLGARDGQFAIVEGVVRKVAEGRNRLYADFGGHDGFTFVVLKRRTKTFERAGVEIMGLTGARVRVRGALDNRFGIRMDVVDPEQIELLDQAPASSGAKEAR
jgi:micrococcal nuclease